METMNYYSDRRVSEAMRTHAYSCNMQTLSSIQISEDFVEWLQEEHPQVAAKFISACWDEDDEMFIINIPVQVQVCSTCRGKGSTVNPSIDCGGISPYEFEEDPEFADGYFSGMYDIQCPECKGLRVTGHVDLNTMGVNHQHHQVAKSLIEYAQELDNNHSEAMHQRMYNY